MSKAIMKVRHKAKDHQKRNPVPEGLLAEFEGFMSACDNDDLPDGAWFAVLEDGAQAFMDLHDLKGDSNSAVFQYIHRIGRDK